MISATEALALPRAQLTAAETEAMALLLVEIDKHIHEKMEFGGCHGLQEFRTSEQNGNVIAAANQRLRQRGWTTNWIPTYGPGQKKGEQIMLGWRLMLTPTDASYAEALQRSQQ